MAEYHTAQERESVASDAETTTNTAFSVDDKSMAKNAASEDAASMKRKYLKWALRVVLLLILIGVIIAGAVNGEAIVDAFEDFLEWVRNAGAVGPIVFALAYAAATVLFLPGLILTIGAGFVFAQAFGQGVGLLVASVVVFIGAVIGASGAFVLGRTILREPVSNYAAKNAKFGAVDTAIREEGLKMVFLLRLSPLIPFNAFNYLAGITSVKFRSYFFASVGMIPGTVVYCFVGTSISNISEAATSGITAGGTTTLVLIIVGTILAVISVAFVSFKAKKAINRAVEDAQNRRDLMQSGDARDFEDSFDLEGGMKMKRVTTDSLSARTTESSYGSEGYGKNHRNLTMSAFDETLESPPSQPTPPPNAVQRGAYKYPQEEQVRRTSTATYQT